MNDIRELYQQMIIDHGRHPRNQGELADASHSLQGYNPLCGDKIEVFVIISNNIIEDIKFTCCGCAISTASASLMSQAIKGKNLAEVKHLFDSFHDLVTTDTETKPELGKLNILAGVRAYPTRVKCATLAWHTLMGALAGEKRAVKTE